MDFKGYYFDTIRLRNELLGRLGEYLLMPRQLDELTAKNDAMLKSVFPEVMNAAGILKARISRQRDIVEARIAATQKLSNDILTLKDAVEKDPKLKELIMGEVGLTTFTINALLDETLVNYKPYLDKAIEYSKAAVATLKDLEAIKTAMKSITSAVNATYNASVGKGQVPNLKEAPAGPGEVFGLPKPVVVTAAVALLGMAAILIRRKK